MRSCTHFRASPRPLNDSLLEKAQSTQIRHYRIALSPYIVVTLIRRMHFFQFLRSSPTPLSMRYNNNQPWRVCFGNWSARPTKRERQFETVALADTWFSMQTRTN